MASSQLFDYHVNNFADVVNHLDALWYEFNKLVAALNSLQQCGDPPDTCGIMPAQKKSPGKPRNAKKPATKAKR